MEACLISSSRRAVIEINPDANGIAAELDREREKGCIRGPLHGIPFLVKDVSLFGLHYEEILEVYLKPPISAGVGLTYQP